MNVKIFVACHDKFYVPKNDLLYPIQVGTALASEKFPGYIHDDEGENISAKNRSYCELTALYWMWKNVDADYYGLFHYRRYLSFNLEHIKHNKYYKTYEMLDGAAVEEMHLSSKDVESLLSEYDIVVPIANNIGVNFNNNYEQYCKSPYLHQKDLDIFLSVIIEKYPYLKDYVNGYMKSHFAYFCNIGVLSKKYFDEYCNILFDVLQETEKRCDTTNYSINELRLYGHLSERLFGIMVKYWESKTQIKIIRLRMVNIIRNNPPYLTPAFPKNNIAIAFSSNNYYSPYLAVAIQSIIENADKKYNYDIIVLDGGILKENQNKILQQVHNLKNFSIRFFDAKYLQGSNSLSSKMHMSVETWYRLYLPGILKGYSKVIYLDCDLVINNSLVELFNTDIEDHLVAATRDLPLVGLYCDGHFVDYFNNVLKLKNPLNYLQAGVLLLNLNKFRKDFTLAELLELAASQDWRWLDQDIMNILSNDSLYILDQKWNVEFDRANIRINQIKLCPADMYLSYMTARKNPAIIHYSGEQKPWAMPEIDMAWYFWKYARKSAFYELILYKVMNSKSEACLASSKKYVDSNLKKINTVTIAEQKSEKIQKAKFGKLLPVGSRRRLFFKRLYYFNKSDKGIKANEYWTVESDIFMHNIITKRNILKHLGLAWTCEDMKKIRAVKNRHHGDRCFIVCTGPSLKLEDLDKIKNEYTIGVNSIIKAYEKTDWRPTYYALVDLYAFGEYLKQNDVPGNKLALAESFLHYRTKLKTQDPNALYVPISYYNHTSHYMKKHKIKFSSDISVCIYDCFTVTNMAIQIAIYMGFKDIYIIGADCNYNPAQMHFIETPGIDDKQRKAKNLSQSVALSIEGYKAAKEFAKRHHVNIYNATRGGKLEVFERVDFDHFQFKK